MEILNQEERDMYAQLLYGKNAIRCFGRIVFQYQGEMKGQKFNSLVGFIETDVRGKCALENNYPHELIECEIIIRPLKRVTGDEGRGMGLAGIATEMLHPSAWSVKLNNDGTSQD